MPSTPLPPENLAETLALAQAVREATDAEIEEIARPLVGSGGAHLFGLHELTLRDLARQIAAKFVVRHLGAKTNGSPGAGVSCLQGGALLAAVPRELDWPRRAGLAEAAAAVVGYLERQAHRMEYPEDLAAGCCSGSGSGSGAVGSVCKTVVGQRRKLAGMRWGEDRADALCHLRALYRSEKGQREAFWNHDYAND